jgi:hypothetical protein
MMKFIQQKLKVKIYTSKKFFCQLKNKKFSDSNQLDQMVRLLERLANIKIEFNEMFHLLDCVVNIKK